MTGMRFIGPIERGKQLRAAANRMRWEVDYVLGTGSAMDGPQPNAYQAASALHELAETLAILRQVMVTIDENTPADDPNRAQLAETLEFYRRYHEVAR